MTLRMRDVESAATSSWRRTSRGIDVARAVYRILVMTINVPSTTNPIVRPTLIKLKVARSVTTILRA
jgi:hypothetical protein